MADDEFLSDDDYVSVPLKEVSGRELHPLGTADRIRELEAALRECAGRLRRAAILAGTDDAYATLAVQRYFMLLDANAGSPQSDATADRGGEHESR